MVLNADNSHKGASMVCGVCGNEVPKEAVSCPVDGSRDFVKAIEAAEPELEDVGFSIKPKHKAKK